MDFRGTMLMEMESRGAGTDIRAIVLAGERVYRVLAEVSLGGGGPDTCPGVASSPTPPKTTRS